jgi:hypothetical protein
MVGGTGGDGGCGDSTAGYRWAPEFTDSAADTGMGASVDMVKPASTAIARSHQVLARNMPAE